MAIRNASEYSLQILKDWEVLKAKIITQVA